MLTDWMNKLRELHSAQPSAKASGFTRAVNTYAIEIVKLTNQKPRNIDSATERAALRFKISQLKSLRTRVYREKRKENTSFVLWRG